MASLHLERLAALVVVAGKDQADASHQSGRQRTPVGGGGRVIVGERGNRTANRNKDRSNARTSGLPTSIAQEIHVFTFPVWTRSCRAAC
jgi:hypothetical protein